MQTFAIPVLPPSARIRPRTAVVASADLHFRQRLSEVLTGLRWHVREAQGGAEAWAEADSAAPEAVIVDSWLPDLDQGEFLREFRALYPEVDLVTADGNCPQDAPRGPHRQELLYALRCSQDLDGAAWKSTAAAENLKKEEGLALVSVNPAKLAASAAVPAGALHGADLSLLPESARRPNAVLVAACKERLPELVGDAACMIEVSRRIRLVAQRSTSVLIEGPTGSGKELVAEALHRLSNRSRKPFVAINCAAIPEALLESELFGHTRGAFTGAVHGRVGRIEAADGGTLFLDEVGEMPLALQAKLLRFVESGELQRVGDNETLKVDVRIVAATHRPLVQHAQDGVFRPDLYYRLAVFLIRTPSLAEHIEDLPMLVEHFLEQMGRQSPMKRIDEAAMARLAAHAWPGNVRELEHVLERAAILVGDAPVLTSHEIDFGLVVN
ncbi:MAG TPA: sigma-54 dependent transcriptional regulator [Terracidiphilus sp.]|nr:sigma-54 dependent transcriptional regulator [Terracidiphilus sp.]